MCWIMRWNWLFVSFLMAWFHHRLHSVLSSVPWHFTGLHFFFFSSVFLFLSSEKSHFPLHLSTDHAKPLIGTLVEGCGSGGRSVIRECRWLRRTCSWKDVTESLAKWRKKKFSKKRFVCNRQATIVPLSSCLICHNMLWHLLTSPVHV